MLELVAQVLVYTGIGLATLVAGYYALDLLTPGKLGELIAADNRGAARLTASALVSLGLIVAFAIYFTGAEWHGVDDALVFGVVGVALQVVGFVALDLVIPGKLGHHCVAEVDGGRAHAAATAASGMHLAVALVIAASLT